STDLARNLAGLWKLRSRYSAENAIPILTEIDRLAREALPPGDPHWLHVGDQFYLLGYVMGTRGRPEPGAEYLLRALTIYRASLPETHTRIVRALGQLMAFELDAGRHAEAEAVAQESLQLLRRTLPDDHWYVALYRARTGACLIGQGRLDEAEPLLCDGYSSIIATR